MIARAALPLPLAALTAGARLGAAEPNLDLGSGKLADEEIANDPDICAPAGVRAPRFFEKPAVPACERLRTLAVKTGS
jgi:hypothetical protein